MYKLTDNTKSATEQTIIRLADKASIPHTDKNHYPVYLDWLAKGNTPMPADPIPVTYSISPSMLLVAVDSDVELQITGAPNETVQIDVDGTVMNIVLDASGYGSDVFVATVTGDYTIKFVNQTLSTARAQIKAVV